MQPTLSVPRSIASDTARSAAADLLKAISIIGVVFIHACFLLPDTPACRDWISASCHFSVPLFILLWAYFAEKGRLKRLNSYSYFRARFYRLLIPFGFWSAIYFLIADDFGTLSFSKVITKHWLGYGWQGQYYFILLFQLLPLFLIISRINQLLQKYSTLLLVASVGFYSVVAYSSWNTITWLGQLGDRPFFYWLPYVFFGIIYARRGAAAWLPVPLWVGLSAPLLIPLEEYYLHPRDLALSSFMIPSVFIVVLLLVHAIMSKTFYYSRLKTWQRLVIATLARNTLGIFCLNPLVIIALTPLYRRISSAPYTFSLTVVITCVSTGVIIALSLLIIQCLRLVRLHQLVDN